MASRPRRVRISILLILTLLFQQVAVAAFACDRIADRPAMTHCEKISMTPMHADVPALCEKHCSPDLSLLSDNATPNVPTLGLPTVVFALVLDAGPSRVLQRVQVPISRSDPPPRLRYCSLLI